VASRQQWQSCALLQREQPARYITQATMYVSAATPSAEVELRSLSLDDVQAACEIYPVTNNFVCLPPSGSGSTSGGCSYARQPGPDSIAGALAFLALGLAFRRSKCREGASASKR